MNFIYKFFILIIIAGLFYGCKQAYNPPAISSPNSYLVVEGVINSGSDSTFINLSYTVNLSSKVTSNPVSNATVTIQSDQNITYPLMEYKKGKYFATNLNLDNSHKYRLSITTANNKQYYSDYVAVLNSPPIDSVYFTLSNNTININSITHDPTNKVQYYRWDYNETWIIHSAYYSYYKSNGDTVLTRDLINDNIYQCWSSDASSTIIINSSSKLKQAIITDNNITNIATSSEKVSHRYSIQVKQYALTADAYNFWANLKKNTEKLGSIFDAQPSEINGNIHSVSDPSEPVIGYISVGSVAIKRIFIDRLQLPQTTTILPYDDCLIQTCLYKFYQTGSKTPINEVNLYINYNKGATYPQIPIGAITTPFSPDILGYTAASPICVDCTLRGTNKQPSFWK